GGLLDRAPEPTRAGPQRPEREVALHRVARRRPGAVRPGAARPLDAAARRDPSGTRARPSPQPGVGSAIRRDHRGDAGAHRQGGGSMTNRPVFDFLSRWRPALVLMAVIFAASATPREDLPHAGTGATLLQTGRRRLGYA